MDKCSSDAEFDSYWDYEAKNKNRNRIRVGRQYQATVPPLLKPGEKDNRKCEDLETLKWNPDKLNDQEIDQYLSMAKAVNVFARAVERSRLTEKSSDSSFQAAFKGLSEFVTSHHPCHHDAGCQVSKPSVSEESTSKSGTNCDWSPAEAQLFAQALGECGKNFCAIKKDFLPWKPVRSIIEYYYSGKGENPDCCCSCGAPKNLSPKSENAASDPSCSYEEFKPLETKEEEQDVNESVMPKSEALDPTEEGKIDVCKVEPIAAGSAEEDSSAISSTVGSLKFFLGGRLVLKLNAQQDTMTGKKCQWVQSNDTPRHPVTVKRMKHKKKVGHENMLTLSIENEKNKKKVDDKFANATLISEGDNLVIKKAKIKTEALSSDTALPCSLLYSTSWTPPVADGQESVELDDGSSKASEGYTSPILLASRGAKIDVKCDLTPDVRSCEPNDIHEPKYDHKHSKVKAEPCSSQAESSYASSILHCVQSFLIHNEKNSPLQTGEDPVYGQEVLNHKCALNHSKLHTKNIAFMPRTAHCSSPVKTWNRCPSTSTDYSDKIKLSPDFHSPNSAACSTSPESSVKDFVLDLSSRPERCACESQELHTGCENCCQSFHSECTENCSSSEESMQTCCNSNNEQTSTSKSSISHLYVKDVQGTAFDTTNKTASDCVAEQSLDTKQSGALEHNDFISLDKSLANSIRENSCHYTCCSGSKSSCTSPQCTDNFSTQEQLCTKDDGTVMNSNHSPTCMSNDTDHKKQPSWFETPVTSFLQFYPQCNPYYLYYGVNPSTSDSSVTEAPLDLSAASGSSKENTSVTENVPEMSKRNADAMDRGMLYQLLQNKVTK